ncbi:MAG: DUF2905 domain-containing protein [Bacteroidota bacterium]
MDEQAGGMESLGKVVLVVAVVLAVAGLLMILMGRMGWHWRPLPGDIVIRRPGLTIFFPIVTMILLSLLITVIMHLIAYFRR